MAAKNLPPPTGSQGHYAIHLRSATTKAIHPDPMRDGHGTCFAVYFTSGSNLRDASLNPKAMEIARSHGPEWIP